MSADKYISNKYLQELAQYGRGLMSVRYPLEIEVYLAALELVDSNGKTIQYFVFPVMPNSIIKSEQNRTNIKKSSSGTTVLMSPSFTPGELTIKGNFGRSFKFLTNPNGDSFSYAIFNNTKGDSLNKDYPQFDPSVKSGYGCIKILQNLVNRSSKLDGNSKPHRLYFYNMALGESYLVAVLPGGLSLTQSYDKNMIWEYSLTMSTLANLEDIKSSEDLTKSSKSILTGKAIQNSVNVLVGEVLNLL